MIGRRPVVTLAALVASLAAACSAAPPSGGDATEPGAKPVILSRTTVIVHPDGTTTTSVDEPGTWQTEAVSIGSCPASTDWFFDQPVGSTNPVNELCLGGSGTIDLSTIRRRLGNWAGAVHSYWTQGSPGYFSEDSTGVTMCDTFGVVDAQTNIDEPNQNARFITLGATSCPVLACSPATTYHCTVQCGGYEKQSCVPQSYCEGLPPQDRQALCCFRYMTCP